MAHQILSFICNESLSCNIILLDRPRPSFKLDNEDVAKNSNSNNKKGGQDENNQEDKKKKKKKNKKKKKKHIDNEDENDEDEDGNKDDDEDNDDEDDDNEDGENEDGDDDDDDDEDDDDDDEEDGQVKDYKSKSKIAKHGKNKQDPEQHSDSDANSKSESGTDSDSDSDSDADSDSDSKNKNREENEYDDDDDYCEENDYLAFKRETYRGTFESKLMDGIVKISYNTKKDEKKERRKKRKLLKVVKDNKNGNTEANSIEYKLSYHKSIEFEFDRFFFTIEHKYNTSIVKMIIFETENRSYEIRFRVDPELGRDNFYYAMIAFQGCYKSQNYDWDDHLKNGNIASIKDLIQEELEILALKGYN